MKNKRPYDHDHLGAMRAVGDPFADCVVSELFEIGYNPMLEGDYKSFQINNQACPATFPKILSEYL